MAILDCSHSLHFYFLITLIHIRITQPFSMSVLCSRTSGPSLLRSNTRPFPFSSFIFQRFVLIPIYLGQYESASYLDVQVDGLLGTFSYYLCLLLLPLFFFFSPPLFPILSLSFVEFVFANKHKLP